MQIGSAASAIGRSKSMAGQRAAAASSWADQRWLCAQPLSRAGGRPPVTCACKRWAELSARALPLAPPCSAGPKSSAHRFRIPPGTIAARPPRPQPGVPRPRWSATTSQGRAAVAPADTRATQPGTRPHASSCACNLLVALADVRQLLARASVGRSCRRERFHCLHPARRARSPPPTGSGYRRAPSRPDHRAHNRGSTGPRWSAATSQGRAAVAPADTRATQPGTRPHRRQARRQPPSPPRRQRHRHHVQLGRSEIVVAATS